MSVDYNSTRFCWVRHDERKLAQNNTHMNKENRKPEKKLYRNTNQHDLGKSGAAD